MSSVQDAYAKFKASQAQQAADSGSSSAYSSSDLPSSLTGGQTTPKPAPQPALMSDGGQIGYASDFAAADREAQLQSLKQRADQARSLREQGYTLTGHDANGGSIYTKQDTTQTQSPSVTAAPAKTDYTPLEQIKRGIVDYNAQGVVGLGKQAESYLSGGKVQPENTNSAKVGNAIGLDNTPAVGPIDFVINAGKLGLDTLTGNTKGQIDDKKALGQETQGIRDRPFEFAAATATDVGGLFIGTTEGKIAGKIGLKGAEEGVKAAQVGGDVAKGAKAAEIGGDVAKTTPSLTQNAIKVIPKDSGQGFVSMTYKVKEVGKDATVPSDALKVANDDRPFLADNMFSANRPRGGKSVTVGLGDVVSKTKDVGGAGGGVEGKSANGLVTITKQEAKEELAKPTQETLVKPKQKQTQTQSQFTNTTVDLGKGLVSEQKPVQQTATIGLTGTATATKQGQRSLVGSKSLVGEGVLQLSKQGQTQGQSQSLIQGQNQGSLSGVKSLTDTKTASLQKQGSLSGLRSLSDTKSLSATKSSSLSKSRQDIVSKSLFREDVSSKQDRIPLQGERTNTKSVPQRTPSQPFKFDIPSPRPNPNPSPSLIPRPKPNPNPNPEPKPNPERLSRGGGMFDLPRGGGGGGFYGGGGGGARFTKTKGLSVKNPFSSFFDIKGGDREDSPVGFSSSGGKAVSKKLNKADGLFSIGGSDMIKGGSRPSNSGGKRRRKGGILGI